jgi:hypothetical protein
MFLALEIIECIIVGNMYKRKIPTVARGVKASFSSMDTVEGEPQYHHLVFSLQ